MPAKPIGNLDTRHRLILAAGWAAIAWGVFQLVATRRPSLAYWAPVVAINALPTLLLGWGAVRRNLIAAAGLGLYGCYRLYVAARMISFRADNPAATPADWWVAPLAIPFALVWVVGAIAAYFVWRRRSG